MLGSLMLAELGSCVAVTLTCDAPAAGEAPLEPVRGPAACVPEGTAATQPVRLATDLWDAFSGTPSADGPSGLCRDALTRFVAMATVVRLPASAK